MSNAPARKSQAIVSDGEGGFELVVTEVGEPRADEVLVRNLVRDPGRALACVERLADVRERLPV